MTRRLSALLLVMVLFTVYFVISTVDRARTYGMGRTTK